MIHYDLKCDKDHAFDGWFQDSAGFDQQAARGDVACPVCGSVSVSKALMAPNVKSSKKKDKHLSAAPAPAELMDAMRKIRRHVEENADYVGDRFADEARRIHYSEKDERGVYGEATPGEIGELNEEGIETCPLPVLPEEQN